MKTLAISASLRKDTGKLDSKALRNQGNVPCVLYGGEKQVYFYAHANDFRNLVYTPNVFIVELDIEGQKYRSVMQDLQFHPVSDQLLHIDFLQIFDEKEITITIPVHLTGNSIGIKNGGNLNFKRKKLTIRSLPTNLPDFIEINIEDLKIGDMIRVKDVRSENYTILLSDNIEIVGVKTSRNAVTDDAEQSGKK